MFLVLVHRQLTEVRGEDIMSASHGTIRNRKHDLRNGSQDHHPSKKLCAENNMLQRNI